MKKLLQIFAGALLGCLCLGASAADAYPSKPIRVVIPFPPGGAVDTLMRSIGPALSAELGQPLVIDNRPGGGAQIGASVVLGAPPDGYTMFVAEIGAFAINPSLYRNISYQPVRDFEGVDMLTRTPMVMYGSPTGKLPSFKALKDAVAAGADISYGSFGPGTAPHILGHQLSRALPKGKFTHIPYKGAPPALQAMMTNEIDLLFDGVPGVLNMVRSSKGVPLAVAAAQRSEYLPQVPTTAELGLPQLQMDLWIGAAVKKGTPPAIVNRLHAAFEKVLADREIWKKQADLGYSKASMTPAQFDAFIKSEIERYRPAIVESGATVE
ncbi:tripartite tricarboxylate transporter substrate binding protein [Pseudacidovorax intermedius]|uniref:Bug family tripartite tricarboxylate transporter substrate binding protein n=1 Tax=Pseudacidovorax intermedius TaxID=433924 RepID=UPI0007349E9C|nr:tripartite tricarboxylate transporter substrate binding protein [Pseudacidovorax intermedius]